MSPTRNQNRVYSWQLPRLRTCEESWWKLRQEVQYSPMIYHHLRMIWWFECRRPCWRSHFAELMILDRFTVSLYIHSILILLHLLKFQGDKWWPHQAADGEANLMVGKPTYFMFGICDDILWIFFLKRWGLFLNMWFCCSFVHRRQETLSVEAPIQVWTKRRFFHGCLDVNQWVNSRSLANIWLKDLEQWKMNKT